MKGKSKLLPLSVIPLVIAADQITKALVTARFESYRPYSVIGDFLRITVKRNTAISFSIGYNLPLQTQRVLFLIIPLLVVVVVAIYYFAVRDVSPGQRWLLAGIMGGGLGNHADRVFGTRGVVDWIDFKFYGIFGFERWPTFNVADTTIVVCGILLLVTMIMTEIRAKVRAKTESQT